MTPETPAPGPGLQTLSPEGARKLLAVKAVNRTAKPGNVAYLARQIQEGKWRATAGTIGLNEEGQLVDGQHRCEAIVEAGMPVEVQIRLVRAADVLAVDTGAQRSAADLFAIRNIANPSQAAACIRLVVTARASVGRPALNMRAGTLLSNEELWEILRGDPRYVEAAQVGRELKVHMPFLAASQIAALYYLFSDATSGAKAREFLEAVAFDTAADVSSLTYGTRRWLLRAEAAKRKPSKYHAFAIFLGTWNRWLSSPNGRPIIPRTIPAVKGSAT